MQMQDNHNTDVRMRLEALLFASGEALTAERLCELAGCSMIEVSTALTALEQLLENGHGLRLYCFDGAYRLGTPECYDDVIRGLVRPRKTQPLSQPTLEVLAIIAYHQPVTKSYIESIRGINCDYAITRLMDLALIEEAGRMDAPGRPMMYGTTAEFLHAFGLSSLSELPEVIDHMQPIDAVDA